MQVNRNASASSFGWEFQANAAVVLFVRHIRQASAVRVEGARDDIEIILEDGSRVYCQAKARATNNPGEGSTTRFYQALETLKDDLESPDCDAILYVTNDDHPFGKTYDIAALHEDAELHFSELSDEVQDFVKGRALEAGIKADDLGKFSVRVIGFYGDDESTRRRIIMRYVENFLESINCLSAVQLNKTRLRSQWGQMLQENSSKLDLSICISKKEFIWPIIVEACEVSHDDKFFDECDEDLVGDVLCAFRRAIDSQSERFSLTTKILSDYQDYRRACDGSRSRVKTAFIKDSWKNYIGELGADCLDEEEQRVLSGLVISKAINRGHLIDSVRMEVGL